MVPPLKAGLIAILDKLSKSNCAEEGFELYRRLRNKKGISKDTKLRLAYRAWLESAGDDGRINELEEAFGHREDGRDALRRQDVKKVKEVVNELLAEYSKERSRNPHTVTLIEQSEEEEHETRSNKIWTEEEDLKFRQLIDKYGRNWKDIAPLMGRSAKALQNHAKEKGFSSPQRRRQRKSLTLNAEQRKVAASINQDSPNKRKAPQTVVKKQSKITLAQTATIAETPTQDVDINEFVQDA